MARLWKKYLANILKLSLAAGLIVWMISSDKLDFSQLKILINRTDIFILNLAIWIIVPLCLGSYRWYTLLNGINLYPTFLRTMQLQLIGFFFNTAIPGAVGGDIVKAVYIMREQGAKRRTPALMSILLDRIIGLCGLFTVGIIAILVGAGDLVNSPEIRPLIYFIFSVFAAMLIFAVIVIIKFPENKDPILKVLKIKIPGRGFLEKLYRTIQQYREKPSALVKAYLLSILIQFLMLCYFYILTSAMLSESVDFFKIGVLFPIGVLTTALPVSPGGIGVGHGAFEYLFHQVGLSNGANIFNVYVLGQLSLNLIGIVPYLFTKSQMPDIGEIEEDITEQQA